MKYIFIEGNDDETYFKHFFGEQSEKISYISYAGMQDKKINGFIQSINRIPNSDYLFIADEDGKGIERKVVELLNKYSSLNKNKVIIVRYEIESWYYAGLSQKDSMSLKLKHYQFDTNSLTKEIFNAKLSSLLERKIVMIEIMKRYSVTLAKSRNQTFADFSLRYGFV